VRASREAEALLDLTNLLSKFVTEGQLPPEVDFDFYRSVYRDLAPLGDATLRSHFADYGRNEGRIPTPAAHRVGFLATVPKAARILEIGPFTRPVFRGDNVKYFDVLDREGLIARARVHGYPTDHCPHIHYVSPTGDLSIVTEKFEYLFSSHCIEHQPDLIGHLQIAARILEPGGLYYLIIPDKRYCFDHYLPESGIDDVLVAHAERRRVHTAQSVIAGRAMATHNNPLEHWRGNHDDPNIAPAAARAAAAEQELRDAAGGYIDVHAWQFTPASFRGIIDELHKRRSSAFAIERVYDTLFGQLEFNAVLRNTGLA
jgi:SAM-dependent methyltransferase